MSDGTIQGVRNEWAERLRNAQAEIREMGAEIDKLHQISLEIMRERDEAQSAARRDLLTFGVHSPICPHRSRYYKGTVEGDERMCICGLDVAVARLDARGQHLHEFTSAGGEATDPETGGGG